MTESWEADSRRHLQDASVLAVVCDMGQLLPEMLRRGWTALSAGESVQISAPSSFWQHQLAAPFVPYRTQFAFNGQRTPLNTRKCRKCKCTYA